jgi:hypothetical protein
VVALEVREEIHVPTVTGQPLSLKAALSAISVQHIAASITALEVHDRAGNVVLVESDDPPVTSDASAYRHWVATRTAVAPISVHYRIPTEPLAKRGEPPLGMEPSGQGVAGCGIGFLLLPENIQSSVTRLHWDLSDLPPASVGVITAGPGTVLVPGSPAEMTKQWFLAGPALSIGTERNNGFHAYIVGDPPFDSRQMLEWADKAYTTIGRYFRYLGLPNYNLFIRAVNGPSSGTGTAGEGKGGSLVSVGTTYWQHQKLGDIQNIVFHEMTHQWVGLIKNRDSWYEEGLTVYISETLPCSAGISSPADCASNLNGALRSYYRSQARNWSQQKITDSPFLSEDIREVPYGRGALFFAALNVKLLQKSHGKRAIADAFQPLFISRLQGHGLTQHAFETMLHRELGAAAVEEFRASMIEGTREILPAPDAFGACLTRVPSTFPTSDGKREAQGYQWQLVGDDGGACRKER